MKRLFPSPLMSASLLIIWLLLAQSLSLGQIILGGFLAIVIPIFTAPVRPYVAAIKKPFALARLFSWAMIEIARSCFNVSRLILFTRKEKLNSQFIKIPLDLDEPVGLAILSCLINSTPGTVWVEMIEGSNELSLHVFDLHDADWWVDTIKKRYEAPIIEFFK